MLKKYSITIKRGILVELPRRKILIDPVSAIDVKPDIVFVSHAHRDHYSLRSLKKLAGVPKVMSRATRDAIDPQRKLDNVYEVNPGETLEVAGVSLEFFEAGHIVGSLQLGFEVGGTYFVYTGDVNIDKRIILRPAPVVKSDVLLIDATYGREDYIFPPRKQLYRMVVNEVKILMESGKSIFLLARRLGVAQELIALVNASLPVPPVVDPEVAWANRLYERYGQHLGKYVISENPSSTTLPHVFSMSRRGLLQGRKIICTGWANNGSGIPLSSHSDFSKLTSYVLESAPQVVVPVYGFKEEFAHFLRGELGFYSMAGERVEIDI